MSSTTGQRRGRQVARKPQKSPMSTFYWVLGGIILVGVGFLIAIALLNRGGSTFEEKALNAPVGQIAAGMSYTTDAGQTINLPAGLWYKGDPNAPVKVVEYADFQCPSCQSFFSIYEDSITRNYVETGRIQFIYHDFPLSQHANAIPAAEAARCAGDQGKFWPMHDIIFTRQNQWESDGNPASRFAGYAGELGLDRAAFEQCMTAGTHTAAVTAAGEASGVAGIPATPTFVVNGQQVGADGLKPALDAALRGERLPTGQ